MWSRWADDLPEADKWEVGALGTAKAVTSVRTARVLRSQIKPRVSRSKNNLESFNFISQRYVHFFYSPVRAKLYGRGNPIHLIFEGVG